MVSDPIYACPDIPTEFLAAIARSNHTVILTGSGTSAESGVPTFRDAQTGLWAKYRPEDLATPEAFRRNPGFVWDWYEWRRGIVAGVQPNPGHYAIADLEQRLIRVTLITQNVDGLHQRAGSTNVIEFHGNIMRSKCSAEDRIVQARKGDDSSPPSCPNCGAPMRPDVVWFGEAIPTHALEAALKALADCDVILSVGTSSQVQPAASLAEQAKSRGAILAEVNPESTPITGLADFVLAGPSGRILPEIIKALDRQTRHV